MPGGGRLNLSKTSGVAVNGVLGGRGGIGGAPSSMTGESGGGGNALLVGVPGRRGSGDCVDLRDFDLAGRGGRIGGL